MLPHPTTMSFAWEEGVQRCSRNLLIICAFAVMALIGGVVVADHAPRSTRAEVRAATASTAAADAPYLSALR